jgi:hypothetical protein
MDFNNLTKENKADIKDVINLRYGINVITSVCSVELDKMTMTLTIYQDREKKYAVSIDYREFTTLFNELILGA